MLFSWSCGGQECPDNCFSMSQSDSQLPEDYFKLLQTSKRFQNTQVMRLWSCLKFWYFCNKFWYFCPIFLPHPLENTEFGLEGPAAGAAGPYKLVLMSTNSRCHLVVILTTHWQRPIVFASILLVLNICQDSYFHLNMDHWNWNSLY